MPANPSMTSNETWGPRCEFVGTNHSSGECAPPPSPPPSIVIAGMPSDIGTFESVLEMLKPRKSTPSCSKASEVSCTSGLSLGVWPTGLSPISTKSTVISPRFQRAFSSATASRAASFARCSRSASCSRSFDLMSIANTASAAMEFTEVPPATVPTVKVVFGELGVSRSPIFAIARPIA